jgi:hypothetical protein
MVESNFVPTPRALDALASTPEEAASPKGGRPRNPTTIEGMVAREFAEQVTQNNRLRALASEIISNIKKLTASKRDDLGTQVEAANAVVALMAASTKTMEALAKNIAGFHRMQAEEGGGFPDELRRLLDSKPKTPAGGGGPRGTTKE